MDEERIKTFFKMKGCLEDDVSVINIGENCFLISSIDTLVVSTDKPILMPWSSVGYKSIIATLSDIAVKGGWPLSISLSMGLEKLSAVELENLKMGILKAIDTYGLNKCFKWDTNKSRDPFLTVSSSALVRDYVPLRSGAKDGDLVCVGGDFGLNRVGLEALLGVKRWDMKLDRNVYLDAIEVFCYPKPPLKEYVEFIQDANPSSSIDSSDGLARSLNLISKLSNIGIEIYDLPAHTHLVSNFSFDKLIDYVFYGGEEYIAIFTLEKKNSELIDNYRFRIIGRVTTGFRGVKVKYNGKSLILKDDGFIHRF